MMVQEKLVFSLVLLPQDSWRSKRVVTCSCKWKRTKVLWNTVVREKFNFHLQIYLKLMLQQAKPQTDPNPETSKPERNQANSSHPSHKSNQVKLRQTERKQVQQCQQSPEAAGKHQEAPGSARKRQRPSGGAKGRKYTFTCELLSINCVI